MQRLLNKKGFSIAELLIAMVLLLIALGLGYNLLFFARENFKNSEKNWIEQNEAISVSNTIYHSLNKAYYVEIYNDLSMLPNEGNYFAYYIDGSGQTILRIKDDTGITQRVLPGKDLSLNFSKLKYVTNEVEFEYIDLMEFSVMSTKVNYNITSQVHLNNMNRDISVQGLDSGAIILFKTRNLVSASSGGTVGGGWCFIATAAYGTVDEPSVRLLRRFRDEYMMKTGLGESFVDFYYNNSPPIADIISQNNVLKLIVRIILYPIVGLVSIIMNPIHLMCVIAGIILALIKLRRKDIYFKLYK